MRISDWSSDVCSSDLLALSPPRTQADLGRVRGLSSGWATNDIGRRLVEALQSAGPLDPDEMPQRDGARPGMGKDSALIADLLKLLLTIRSKEADVAAKLRSEERRVGKECVSPCRTQGSPVN